MTKHEAKTPMTSMIPTINNEDDDYDKNNVCISNEVLIRLSNNDGINEKNLNLNKSESGNGKRSSSRRNICTMENENEK